MTAIEWTDATWNPTTGCDRISPGCDHCYALTMARRLKAMGQPKYQRDGNQRTSGPGFAATAHPDTLTLPLSWRTPRAVFVNSMSDLFHHEIPATFIGDVWTTMARAHHHRFQILTKRPARAHTLLADWADDGWRWPHSDRTWSDPIAGPLPNVWLGTSVEDQHYGARRIRPLAATPATLRFLSCEPLLGPLQLDLTGIGWVIVGGESGPGARPMDLGWARDLRDQCADAGVPLFVKQLGTVWARRTGAAHAKGTDPQEWPGDLHIRQTPAHHPTPTENGLLRASQALAYSPPRPRGAAQ